MIGIEANEKIILKVRRHWFVIVSEVIALIVYSLLPLIGSYFAFNFNLVAISGSEFYFILAAESIWLIFVWMMFAKFWVDYDLDVWVITNKRLIDIEQRGLFKRDVSVVRLDRIEDMTILVNGIVRSFLKFGEIRVQSAGEAREFIMRDIANPYEVKTLITKLSDDLIEGKFTR